MKGAVKRMGRGAVAPLGKGLSSIGISADAVTVAGLLAAVVSAWGFATGSRPSAFFGLLGSGFCDLLDGAVARAGGRKGTPFGAALDSTLDRYGEGAVFAGILIRISSEPSASWWLAVLAAAALIGSFLVSYVRARSEGLGIPCEVGVLERPERIVALLVLAVWGFDGMPWILGALAVLSHVTFLQRLRHVRRHAATASGQPGAPSV